MRTRSASLLLLALALPGLTIGCRPFCGWQQWNCDTFGACAFGTQPSYGRFAPPGPHPAPQYGPTYGAPIQTAPTYNGTFVEPHGATLGQPMELQNPPAVPSF